MKGSHCSNKFLNITQELRLTSVFAVNSNSKLKSYTVKIKVYDPRASLLRSSSKNDKVFEIMD